MRANHPILKKLIEAYLYDPIKIRYIIKSSPNPAYMFRLAKELMPYRVGIEIDATGFDDDLRIKLRKLELNKFGKKIAWYQDDNHKGKDECNETRFSFMTYTGLLNFQKFLKMLKDNKVKLTENGGLHIHIDLAMGRSEAEKKEIAERLMPYFKYIRNKVFKCGEMGDETNESIQYSDRAKICVARSKTTIEYRMSDPTFNYTTIIRQVLCCQEFNKAMKRNRKVNLELTNMILAL